MTISQGYDAARAGAAFSRREGRGKIAVAGQERKTYLHAMLTNDIATLQPGGGCYAAYLTPQGRMMTDLRVFELGDLTFLEMRAAEAPLVLEKLDQFVFTEDVKLGDLTDAFEEIRLVGPSSGLVVVDALRGAAGQAIGLPAAEELAGWPEFRNARRTLDGEMVLVTATRELGVPGFDLFVEKPRAGRLEQALAAAGATPLSSGAAETLRIEAGRPLFGLDMDTETIPLEAGIEARAISFTKGCYPGQEVIIRVLHRGHGRVARRLCGIAVEGGEVPARGDVIRSAGQKAGATPDEARVGATPPVAEPREAGRVTSATWSPRLGHPIALAWLHRDFVEPGTPLTIEHEGTTLAGRAAALPFVGSF